MKTLKIGIIGCGGIANGKHMPALKKLEDVEMVAFCDLIPERAKLLTPYRVTEEARRGLRCSPIIGSCWSWTWMR